MSIRITLKNTDPTTPCGLCGKPMMSLKGFYVVNYDRQETLFLCKECKEFHFPVVGKCGWVKE